jgi:hypothetical protein
VTVAGQILAAGDDDHRHQRTVPQTFPSRPRMLPLGRRQQSVLAVTPKDHPGRLQPDESRAFSRALSCALSCSSGSLVLQEIIGPDATNQTHRSGLSGMLTAADWNDRVYQVRPCPPLHGLGCQALVRPSSTITPVHSLEYLTTPDASPG